MSTIRWIEDLEAASQLAKDYEKLMLIEFYSDQCYWCDQLDRNTFTDTEIIQLTSEFRLFEIEFINRRKRINAR